jgi:hypothetical protein
VPDFTVFHRHGANEPSMEKALWVLRRMRECGLRKESSCDDGSLAQRLFRMDLFERARRCRAVHTNLHENKKQSDKQLALN